MAAAQHDGGNDDHQVKQLVVDAVDDDSGDTPQCFHYLSTTSAGRHEVGSHGSNNHVPWHDSDDDNAAAVRAHGDNAAVQNTGLVVEEREVLQDGTSAAFRDGVSPRQVQNQLLLL